MVAREVTLSAVEGWMEEELLPDILRETLREAQAELVQEYLLTERR